MHHLTDILQIVFFALGSTWFAVDLISKLNAPQAAAKREREEPAVSHPRSTATVASAPIVAVPAPDHPAAEPAPAVVVPAVSPVSTTPVESPVAGVPSGHLAAISAVVHHLFKGRAHLVSALPASALSNADQANIGAHVDWAREGRREIFSSHRIR